MKLYHGTTGFVARLAILEGLKPRSDSGANGNWEHTVSSNPDIVYLTAAYAPYFAATAQPEDVRLYDQEWGIVEVDLDRLDITAMLPDEDFMEQATRDMKRAGCPPWMCAVLEGEDMKGRTEFFREHLTMFAECWRDSVKGIGNASHYGIVPPEAVTRVALFKPNEEAGLVAIAALDPTITILNYQIVGAKYRALTRWFMGEALTPAEFYAEGWAFMRDRIDADQLARVEAVLTGHPGLTIMEPTG